MSEATSQVLLRAYELIEADKQDEARSMLEPILESERENADAWWLYVHAVDSAEEAQRAMENLRSIDPHYPGMKELDERSKSGLAHISESQKLAREFSEAVSDRGWIRWVLLAAVVLIVILGFVLFFDDSDKDTPEATIDAVIQNLPTTAVGETGVATTAFDSAQPMETTEPVLTLSEEDVAELLVDFQTADPVLRTQDTALGRTTLVRICLSDDPRAVLDAAMLRVAELSPRISDSVYVGVEIVDCSMQSSVNSVIVALSDAQQYHDGTIDQQMYLSRWRALG